VRHTVWVVLLCALPAQAYVRSLNDNGLCVYWAAHGHSFQIDAQGTPDITGTAAFDAIRRSFATWAAVSCSDLAFPEEPLSTSASDRVVGFFSGRTNHNLVLFRTQSCRTAAPANDPCHAQGGCSNAYDCWDFGDTTIATTTTTSNGRSGEILDSDIEMNDAPAASGGKFTFTAVDGPPCLSTTQTGCVRIDVQNTVTHEAGHTLGLDHVPDHPEATMYPSSVQGEITKRVLAADDVQGICAIYPRGAPSVSCVPPDPAGGCGCSHAQTGPGAALCALLLLLRIRRRSRSRPQLAMRARTDPAIAARSQSGSKN